MKIAIFSDLHGNLPALQTILDLLYRNGLMIQTLDTLSEKWTFDLRVHFFGRDKILPTTKAQRTQRKEEEKIFVFFVFFVPLW